jgi:hypothetical protein
VNDIKTHVTLLLACTLIAIASGCASSALKSTPADGPWETRLDRIASFNGTMLVAQNHLWNVKTGRAVTAFAVPDLLDMSNGIALGGRYLEAVTFAPDGRTLLTATSRAFLPEGGGIGGEFLLWSARTGQKISRSTLADGNVYDLEFSADGRRIGHLAPGRTMRVVSGLAGRTARPHRLLHCGWLAVSGHVLAESDGL